MGVKDPARIARPGSNPRAGFLGEITRESPTIAAHSQRENVQMTSFRNFAKFIFVAVFIATIPLAAPASAETDAPTIGCNSDGCSLWFIEYAWPDVVELNGLEFFRVHIDVNKLDAELRGSIQYLGVICLIPGVSSSPVCPQASDPELESAEASNILEYGPGPWRWTAERLERPRPLGVG